MPSTTSQPRELETEQVPAILARALRIIDRYPSGRIIETRWSERTQTLQLSVDTVPGALHLFTRLTRTPIGELPEPVLSPKGFLVWAGDVRSGGRAYLLAVGALVRPAGGQR